MDVEVSLDRNLVGEIDRLVGRRNRPGFIEGTVRSAIERERRRARTAATTVEDLWAPEMASWRRKSAAE